MFLYGNRILKPIHRIILSWIALEMNLGDQRLISWTDREQMKVCAAPKLGRARGIGTIGNRANAFQLVVTRFR